MDLTTSGLAGVNEKFNNILKKVDSVADTMKAQIQGDASAAAAAIGGDLSSLTGELRSLIPQGLELPNINLQSQLSSLSSISDPTQAANLLSSITSSFGTELSASGFNLDTLVSNAKSAIAGGTSLSFSIPNFEKPADGVSAAFQKAVAVKIPDKEGNHAVTAVATPSNKRATSPRICSCINMMIAITPTEKKPGISRTVCNHPISTQSNRTTSITKLLSRADQTAKERGIAAAIMNSKVTGLFQKGKSAASAKGTICLIQLPYKLRTSFTSIKL